MPLTLPYTVLTDFPNPALAAAVAADGTDYYALLTGVARRCAMADPTGVQDAVSAELEEHINNAVQKAWDHHTWARTVVTSEVEVTDGTIPYTEPADPVAWANVREMGTVLGIFAVDPRLAANRYRRELPFEKAASAIYLVDAPALEECWVQWRPEAPEFSKTMWESTATYAPFEVIYHAPTKRCYRCRDATTAGEAPPSVKWEPLWVPPDLIPAIKALAAAYALATDGQEGKAARRMADAIEELDVEVASEIDREGQHLTWGGSR